MNGKEFGFLVDSWHNGYFRRFSVLWGMKIGVEISSKSARTGTGKLSLFVYNPDAVAPLEVRRG